jgi:hypothetical protein
VPLPAPQPKATSEAVLAVIGSMELASAAAPASFKRSNKYRDADGVTGVPMLPGSFKVRVAHTTDWSEMLSLYHTCSPENGRRNWC